MPNLTGLNLNVDSNQDRLEKTPSWTERLQNKLSVLTPQSVTEPGFIDALTQPTDAPRDMSNFSAYMGSGIRRGVLDPLKRYAMAVDKGMKGQPLSPADILAITEVNMDVAMGGFLKKGVDPNKVRSFPAWHGGGKAFKKFEDKAIGTGEGFQAFGRGHYLTDSKGIAESYARKIGKSNVNHPAYKRNQKLMRDWQNSQEMKYKGKNLWFNQDPETPEDWIIGYLVEEVDPGNRTKKEVSDRLSQLKKDLIADYEATKSNPRDSNFFFEPDEDPFGHKELLDFIDTLDINDFEAPKVLPKPKLEEVPDASQNLYKTTVMKGKEPDEYDFIDYHKPLNQQGVDTPALSKESIQELRKNELFKRFADDNIHQPLKTVTEAELKGAIEKAPLTFYEKKLLNSYLSDHIKPSEPSPIMEKIKQTDTWKEMEYVAHEFGEEMDEDMTISQFIERAEQIFDLPEEELIKELAAVGLPGIKYAAGTIAGGAKKGTKNYVVFNPDDITIEEHYINGVLQKPTD